MISKHNITTPNRALETNLKELFQHFPDIKLTSRFRTKVVFACCRIVHSQRQYVTPHKIAMKFGKYGQHIETNDESAPTVGNFLSQDITAEEYQHMRDNRDIVCN